MAAAPQILIPAREQARAFYFVGLLMLLAAGICLLCKAKIAALATAVIAGTPLFLGAVVAGVAREAERGARALIAGDHLLSWIYPPEQWRAYVAAERGRGRSLGALMAAAFALAGVGIAAVTAQENDRLLGARALLWVVPPLAGAMLGLGIALVIAWRRRLALARMDAATGVFYIGASGMYVTGSYWPWQDRDVRLLGVGVEGTALVFRFRFTRGVRYADRTVHVPIAPGHEDAARRVAAQLDEARR